MTGTSLVYDDDGDDADGDDNGDDGDDNGNDDDMMRRTLMTVKTWSTSHFPQLVSPFTSLKCSTSFSIPLGPPS